MMTEICRVLPVTLLPCLCWLQSETFAGIVINARVRIGSSVLFLSFVAVEAEDVGAADPPPDPDAFIFSLLEKYISSGCKDAHNATNLDSLIKVFSPGISIGKKNIIELLAHYFSFECYADFLGENADEIIARIDFTTSEKHIYKLLAAYVSSGCDAAKTVEDSIAEERQTTTYSAGEERIRSQISSYISSGDCKDPPERDLPPGPTGNPARGDDDTPTTKKRSGEPDSHAKSLFLGLFLIVFGMCLTRI